MRVRCVQRSGEAAAAQSKFWRCTPSLLRPDKLGIVTCRRYSKEVGLDLERFDREMASGIYAIKY